MLCSYSDNGRAPSADFAIHTDPFRSVTIPNGIRDDEGLKRAESRSVLVQNGERHGSKIDAVLHFSGGYGKRTFLAVPLAVSYSAEWYGEWFQNGTEYGTDGREYRSQGHCSQGVELNKPNTHFPYTVPNFDIRGLLLKCGKLALPMSSRPF